MAKIFDHPFTPHQAQRIEPKDPPEFQLSQAMAGAGLEPPDRGTSRSPTGFPLADLATGD
jgi:hypothetical protein